MEVVFIFGVGGGGTNVVIFVAVGVKRVMEADDAELEQWNGRAVVGNLYSATYPEAKRMTMTERAVQPPVHVFRESPGNSLIRAYDSPEPVALPSGLVFSSLADAGSPAADKVSPVHRVQNVGDLSPDIWSVRSGYNLQPVASRETRK